MMKGKITQVIGPVVDVRFDEELPSIYDALVVQNDNGQTVTLEVALQLGDHVVRTIALEPTEGLRRDLEVISSGTSVQVPVGKRSIGSYI